MNIKQMEFDYKKYLIFTKKEEIKAEENKKKKNKKKKNKIVFL